MIKMILSDLIIMLYIVCFFLNINIEKFEKLKIKKLKIKKLKN